MLIVMFVQQVSVRHIYALHILYVVNNKKLPQNYPQKNSIRIKFVNTDKILHNTNSARTLYKKI